MVRSPTRTAIAPTSSRAIPSVRRRPPTTVVAGSAFAKLRAKKSWPTGPRRVIALGFDHGIFAYQVRSISLEG